MDGYKFDLRLYVLVSSCDPLKIFLYKDGLVNNKTLDIKKFIEVFFDYDKISII